MAKSRPAGRTQSIANPTVYRHGPRKEVKDDRSKSDHQGQQGRGKCAQCGAEMNLRKATTNNPSRFGDITDGSRVVPNHRIGGGRYSLIRNDVLCPGAGLRPKREDSDG